MDEDVLRRLDLGDDSRSDFEFPEDELMDYEIAEVLEPKLAFGYESHGGLRLHGGSIAELGGLCICPLRP
jgi:hypothetical protein